MFADITMFLDPTLIRGLKLAHGRERLQKYLYLYNYHYYFEGTKKLERTGKITKKQNQKSLNNQTSARTFKPAKCATIPNKVTIVALFNPCESSSS